MSTILDLIVARLNIKINNLERARIALREKNLEDKALERQLNRLSSMRGRLTKTSPTGNVVSPSEQEEQHG